MITVMVTGVGGPLGQAVVKALRMASLDCRVIGVDRLELSVGLDWVDERLIAPDCSFRDRYLDAIVAHCRKGRVSALIPGSDRELVLLSKHRERLKQTSGVELLAPPTRVLEIALDKLATCRFLQARDCQYPQFAPLEDAESVEALIHAAGLPLLAKPIRGSGSQGLVVVRHRADLRYLATLDREYVVQEYLRPDDQEYTVAVFTEADGRQTGAIALRRELAAGNTYRAWVEQRPEVLAEARRVASRIESLGPLNVQLRLTERGPVTFEINPRFSGTTAMRAHFGFNEVEMALRSFVLGERLKPPQVRPGVALRYWNEHYLESEQRCA